MGKPGGKASEHKCNAITCIVSARPMQALPSFTLGVRKQNWGDGASFLKMQFLKMKQVL